MFKELDPLLHSQLRLAVMSILLSVEEAEFVYIKEKTSATAGNLSVQLDKLNEAYNGNIHGDDSGKNEEYFQAALHFPFIQSGIKHSFHLRNNP